MKRRKSFIAGITAFVLSITLALGGMSFAAKPAKAEASSDTLTINSAKIVSTVDYGKTFTVPTGDFTVTVTAPNGTTVSPAENNVTANQLGVYTVKCNGGSSDISYTYKVYCKLGDDYQLFIDDEADIPSYVKTGETKTLPAAKVGYIDEDGEKQFLDKDQGDYTIKVTTDSDMPVTGAEGDKYNIEFTNPGSTFVTYQAQLGADGTKYLSKTFEVKVQNGFKDEIAPTLSVSGVPSSGNLNMPVTIPVATATDTFDERVKVVITVTDKDGNPAKEAEVDKKRDIATGPKAGDNPQKFDNADNMKFYPLVEGDYKVTYKAIDDSGKESAAATYTIKCADRKAPTLSIDDTRIPEKWGYDKVTKKDSADIGSTNIKFPEPNKDETYDNYTTKENIKISFTLVDPDSRTIANFTNINGEGSELEYTNDGSLFKPESKTYTWSDFTTTGFDIAEYVAAMEKDTSVKHTPAGDYVATYSATDGAANRVSRSFTINISETFDDDSEVKASFDDVEDYILLEDEEVKYTIPTPTYASATDSKLTLDYQAGSESDKKPVKAGDTVTIKKENTDIYLVIDEQTRVQLGDKKLYLQIKATSDAGNVNEENEDSKIAISILDRNAGTGESTMFEIATEDNDIMNTSPDVKATPDEESGGYKLGSFKVKIKGDEANAKNVGVELGLRDQNGKYITNGFGATIYNAYKTGNESNETVKVVRDITAKINQNGTYFLEVRVFDIEGNSEIHVFKVSVDGASGSVDPEETIPTAVLSVDSAEVNSTIDLSGTARNGSSLNSLMKITDGTVKAVYRTVKGGKFALMGDKLTVMSASEYSVTEGVAVVVKISPEKYIEEEVGDTYFESSTDNKDKFIKAKQGLEKTDTVTVSDSAAVLFEVQGVMQSYVPKKGDKIDNDNEAKGEIVLPDVAAFTENAPADEITLSVKSPKGTDVTVKYTDKASDVNYENDKSLATGNKIEAGKKYYFIADDDGTYTVTYKVKMSQKEVLTKEFEIKAGDVIAPEFTVDGSHDQNVSSGFSFSFRKITFEQEKNPNDKSSDCTFTKRIVGPDGEEVGLVNGKGDTYMNRTTPSGGAVTLTASGKYTVTYTVTDAAGNSSTKEFVFTVTGSSKAGGLSPAALGTILTVVGVLLIVGVIVYLFRFRRVKKS